MRRGGPVEGEVEEVAKVSTRDPQRRHSNWFITINTQVPESNPESDVVLDQLGAAIKTIFNPNNLYKIVDVIEEDVVFDSNSIIKAKIKFSLEVGTKPKGSRIHSHVLLKITHRTKIRLSNEAIRGELKRLISSPAFINPHIFWIVVSPEANIREYIAKAPAI